MLQYEEIQEVQLNHLLELQLFLDEVFELVCPSTCRLDHLGVCVNQVVFDEVQAGFNVGILKLDEVKSSRDLLLH